MIIDIIGWIALIAIMPSALFQVIKNFQRKSTEGVSLLMAVSIFVGLSLFLVVSFARPTPIPTLVQFLGGSVVWGIVLLQMFIYRKEGKVE
ncbi:MAG: PQ-loop repeat-containing protein [Candidatus Spechtbacterales bacterium]